MEITNMIQDIGLVNSGNQDPLLMARTLRRFDSAMLPKITPINRGVVGISTRFDGSKRNHNKYIEY